MKSHFHMKGWAPRLALRKRLKVIWKWPIERCKTKPKVITLANHKGHGQSREPIKTRSNYM